jgi:hypothetical protein
MLLFTYISLKRSTHEDQIRKLGFNLIRLLYNTFLCNNNNNNKICLHKDLNLKGII